MSDLAAVLLAVWSTVMITLFIMGGIEYSAAYDIEDRKYFARFILVAPFWPVAAVYLILRYIPTITGRTIARLMYDATRT